MVETASCSLLQVRLPYVDIIVKLAVFCPHMLYDLIPPLVFGRFGRASGIPQVTLHPV